MAEVYRLAIVNPYPVFIDHRTGLPLESGYIYIGEEHLDPKSNPINVYWDEEGTIDAGQPLRTISGYISYNGSPGFPNVGISNYSITVRDKNNELVFTRLSVNSPVLDEDDFISDSPTKAPSQQSTKVFIEEKIALNTDSIPIGTYIALNQSVDVAKVIDSDVFILCDGIGTFRFKYSDGTESGDIGVPDLSDSRFLMGGPSGSGGSNTLIDHTHAHSLTAAGQAGGNHTHTYTRYSSISGGDGSGNAWQNTTTLATAGTGAHTHNSSSVSGTIGTGDAVAITDSRPLYLSCKYYLKKQ